MIKFKLYAQNYKKRSIHLLHNLKKKKKIDKKTEGVGIVQREILEIILNTKTKNFSSDKVINGDNFCKIIQE